MTFTKYTKALHNTEPILLVLLSFLAFDGYISVATASHKVVLKTHLEGICSHSPPPPKRNPLPSPSAVRRVTAPPAAAAGTIPGGCEALCNRLRSVPGRLGGPLSTLSSAGEVASVLNRISITSSTGFFCKSHRFRGGGLLCYDGLWVFDLGW